MANLYSKKTLIIFTSVMQDLTMDLLVALVVLVASQIFLPRLAMIWVVPFIKKNVDTVANSMEDIQVGLWFNLSFLLFILNNILFSFNSFSYVKKLSGFETERSFEGRSPGGNYSPLGDFNRPSGYSSLPPSGFQKPVPFHQGSPPQGLNIDFAR